MSQSFAFRAPVAPFVGAALWNSLKLGGVAFALVVPLGILGGIVAALNRGRLLDRAIVLVGLSATVVPEFVSGIVLILVFGIGLQLFPISATPPPGAGAADAALLPRAARHPARLHRLRLHRPHGARRHRRGARQRLHPHRRAQGPALARRGAAPRAAQRAAAHHHGRGVADRLPRRRPRGDRDAVPLPGHRQPHLHGGARPRLSHAGGRHHDGRGHLRRVDARRRHAPRGPQPTDPPGP